MNFFQKKTTWTQQELIVLKLSIASIYLVIGAHFHEFFSSYSFPLLILFGITVIISGYLWIKKMKTENDRQVKH